MKFKVLRIIVTAVLLVILCACSAEPVIESTPPTTPERSDAAVPPQTESTIDVTYLLSSIAESGEPLECFPALIEGADILGDGCVLHFDRLEINPDYQPGSLGGETYLLNKEVKIENIKTASLAYAEYDAKTAEIGKRFADYIAGFDDDAQFTVFKLGDEVIFLSEITVP